ncbi:MAG: flagellar basal body L-ring protein FlgH [Candidatus Polarisedimenticolaceae bacterium]|nr:flagellar basal body L-ring protein FlgH [Candidatus Polarisedimenticolaceae bacterium]
MNRLPPILAMILLLLSGCSSGPKRDINYAPVRAPAPTTIVDSNGSIYMSGHKIAWFEDIRAHRVGDILTVVLSESTSAKKSAKTSTGRTNNNNITSPTILGSGLAFSAPGVLPLASHTNNNLGFTLASDHSFEGEGSSTQSNDLTGNVTVTVIEVLANRNLVIRGEKRMGINQGNEYVKLSGIIRPQDITPQNTIDSSRIADVTIIYNGDGHVADSGSPGWLSRLFSGELFPF